MEVIPLEKFQADAEALRIHKRIDALVEKGNLDYARKLVKVLYYSYGIDIGFDGGQEIIGWSKNY